MPLAPQAQPLPKRSDRVVIVHISDLHFDGSSRPNGWLWKALCDDIQAIDGGADLLAVTGDVIDSSVRDNLGENGVYNSLVTVKGYLEHDVCAAAGVDPATSMLVIPGNHDYGLKGLWGRTLQFELFGDQFKPYFKNRLFEGLGLSVFVFDSNTRDRAVNFATGVVDPKALVEHNKLVREIGNANPAFWSACTRVVLVHHHPMPIAPTQHRDDIAGGEEFMLLKNAGLFMELMVRTKMDLVLHGHRHYPAYSRVSFPTSEGDTHSIAIVSAGSVGKKDDYDYSYNIITVKRSGEMSMERRVLRSAIYELDKQVTLSSYDAAREKRCLPPADKLPRIRATKYVRVDTICAGSGDVVIDEAFYEAQSLTDEPIPVMPRTITSNSGFFGEWSYKAPENQRIEWEWDGLPTDGQRKGLTKLTPPLGKKPITFSRTGTTFNAIYFNQRDRLDATDQKYKTEWTTMATRHIYDSAVFQVSFPSASFPADFWVEVTQSDEKTRDTREEEFLRQRLTVFSNTCSVVLAMPAPIPNYSYRIVWDLPENDKAKLNLSAVDEGLAETIGDKLLLLRDPACPHKASTEQAMEELRQEIVSAPAFASSGQDNALEVELFTYDEKARGLVFVATLSNRGGPLSACVIKPGRYVVGQAYRRREEVLLINVGKKKKGVVYYETISGQENLPPHTVIFSLPLFYPIRNGIRVGALALGSRSLTSGLLRLETDPVAVLALKAQLLAWYADKLAPALGLQKLPLDLS